MITNKDLSIDSENGKITLNGNKYDLGTQGEIDTAVKDVYSVMGQMGAKNLIPYPYPKLSTTVRGITWSDNGDGGIVGNGTGTEESSQPFCELNGSSTNNAKNLLLKANTWYTLTCKRTSPYAIGANIYFLDPTTMQQTSITFDVIYGDSANTTATKNNVYMYNAGVVSEEVKFKIPRDMYAEVQVRYKAGTDVTVSNDVQYPMLRLASDIDNTYQPYAMTNKQLTDQVADVDAYTVSDITDLNQSITVNEFSLRKCGKIVTIGLNFNASDAIAQFTNLFKLPSGIESFGRIDAVGIFATSTPNIALLTVDDNGYVVANSAIAAASYYLGAIVFICDED